MDDELRKELWTHFRALDLGSVVSLGRWMETYNRRCNLQILDEFHLFWKQSITKEKTLRYLIYLIDYLLVNAFTSYGKFIEPEMKFYVCSAWAHSDDSQSAVKLYYYEHWRSRRILRPHIIRDIDEWILSLSGDLKVSFPQRVTAEVPLDSDFQYPKRKMDSPRIEADKRQRLNPASVPDVKQYNYPVVNRANFLSPIQMSSLLSLIDSIRKGYSQSEPILQICQSMQESLQKGQYQQEEMRKALLLIGKHAIDNITKQFHKRPGIALLGDQIKLAVERSDLKTFESLFSGLKNLILPKTQTDSLCDSPLCSLLLRANLLPYPQNPHVRCFWKTSIMGAFILSSELRIKYVNYQAVEALHLGKMCNQCGLRFTDEELLKKHLDLHFKANERKDKQTIRNYEASRDWWPREDNLWNDDVDPISPLMLENKVVEVPKVKFFLPENNEEEKKLKCNTCLEEFPLPTIDQDTGLWILEDVIQVGQNVDLYNRVLKADSQYSIDTDLQQKMEMKLKDQILHLKCYRCVVVNTGLPKNKKQSSIVESPKDYSIQVSWMDHDQLMAFTGKVFKSS